MSEPEQIKVRRMDSIPLDTTYFTEEGFLIDHPIVTSVGIFVYHNADGTERRELRLPEEVFAAKSLASYKGKPVIVTHDAGYVDTENVQQEHIGTMLSEGYQDGDNVRVELVIHGTDYLKSTGLRELSLGYSLRLDKTPGVWNGQAYDAIQRDIEINHLALVDKARAGEQARLNIDGRDQTTTEGGKETMANNRKDGDMEKSPAVEAFNKRRAERLAAAADKATAAAEAAADNGDCNDGVQAVRDRRDRRDTEGDPADMGGAMDVIAQQDEDIEALLGIIDALSAGANTDGDDCKKDGEGESEGDEGHGDGDGAEGTEGAADGDGEGEGEGDEGKKNDRADAADNFRELLRVVRIGDRLNMDGLETMSVCDAKKAVLKKLKPTMRLDGKSSVYVAAAFDVAVDEMNEHKGTNYQRKQMMHGDGKAPTRSVGSAADARQRMIDKRMKKEDK